MNNRLVLAAAGSGKTTFIVNEASNIKTEKVLILTFTNANEQVISKMLIKKNRCIPSNITIRSWFSFLLQHGARPYQAYLFEERLKGMILVNKKSGLRNFHRGRPFYWPESTVGMHYMTSSKKLYSDKISKFTMRVNAASNNKVIDRIAAIYKHIFIDEVQDLAGYDLEIIKELFKSESNILLVGDPRQVTYTTHFPDINKPYMNGRIVEYIADKCKSVECELDTTTLNKSYRNWPELCELSSKLYSTLPTPGSTKPSGLNTMYFLDRDTLIPYLRKKQAVQLRLRRTSSGPVMDYPAYNFGDSKGLTFRDLVLFPTDAMKLWLKSGSSPLTDLTRAQLYVGLTRASESIGIYLDGESISEFPFLSVWLEN